MTNWNKTDSMAYVMFYAAKADQVITADERELINSKFDATTLSRIEAEINDDNDYQRLEKIDAYVKSNNCTEGKVEKNEVSDANDTRNTGAASVSRSDAEMNVSERIQGSSSERDGTLAKQAIFGGFFYQVFYFYYCA